MSYIKNVALLISLLLIGSQPIFAQNTRNLSLSEAVDLSLKTSKQIRLSQVKIHEATATLNEAKGNRLPDLSISGSYLRLAQPTIDLKVKLGSSSSTSSDQKSSAISVDQATYGMVNASMPLFAGNRINYGIQSARYLEMATKLDADKNREEVIQNTIAAYSNLYKAKEALELVKESLKESKQRVNDFSNMEKNGIMARNDLLKAELQESNVELTLLDAENNWKITNINMDMMLGLPEEMMLIPDTNSFSHTTDAGSIADWEQKALLNRKDAASLVLREKAAKVNIKATKSDYYPSVALSGGYLAADVPNLITITNALNVGIGLKYSPSLLWKGGPKLAQARARLEEIQISEESLNDNIRIQINQAYQNYILSQKKIDVYNVAVDQAKENYKIIKNKYDNSLATTTDLLDADVAQLQAKLNYAFAKADAVVAYNNLLQTAGLLNIKIN
ncbi:MAG: TolC family protein [Bacteroidota bacterium]